MKKSEYSVQSTNCDRYQVNATERKRKQISLQHKTTLHNWELEYFWIHYNAMQCMYVSYHYYYNIKTCSRRSSSLKEFVYVTYIFGLNVAANFHWTTKMKRNTREEKNRAIGFYTCTVHTLNIHKCHDALSRLQVAKVLTSFALKNGSPKCAVCFMIEWVSKWVNVEWVWRKKETKTRTKNKFIVVIRYSGAFG